MKWNAKKVNGALLQSIQSGEGIPKIASRLQTVTDMNKRAAIRNARTMVTSAENVGRVNSMKDLANQGVDMLKKWMSTWDDRTRDTHLALNGQKIPINKTFSNGLKYPGDPNGEPAEVYNCRCTLGYVYNGFNKTAQGENSAVSETKKAPLLDMVKESNFNKFLILNKEKILKVFGKPTGEAWRRNLVDKWQQKNVQSYAPKYIASSYESADTVRELIPYSYLKGWFVEADSAYKPKIMEIIFKNNKLRDAGASIAYNNYIEFTESKISFNDFMSTPITLYRGTNAGDKTVDLDYWESFSFDKKMAEAFGSKIEKITVKMSDTLGAFQTTAEHEILVPSFLLKKIRMMT